MYSEHERDGEKDALGDVFRVEVFGTLKGLLERYSPDVMESQLKFFLPQFLSEQLAGKSPEEIERYADEVEELTAKLKAGQPLYVALGLGENFVEDLYAEGYRYYSSGLYDKALPFFNQAMFFVPRDPRFPLARAAALQRLKRYDEAIVAYRELAALAPDLPLPYFYIYECYDQLGDHAAAIKALETLVACATASGTKYETHLAQGRALLEGYSARYGEKMGGQKK